MVVIDFVARENLRSVRYLRNDNFNIWLTIIAIDDERIEYILEQVGTSLSLENSQVLNLPIKHLFKLNACFKVAL